VGVVGVVLAAGHGARFAAADAGAPPKMLAPIDNVPMVRCAVESLLRGGVPFCIVVVAASGEKAIGRALEGLPVRLVINPTPARGMFSSVQCGMASARQSELCLLLPGDMPFVAPSTVADVIAEARRTGATVAPSLDGHCGHPVACSSSLRARIATVPVDSRLDHLMEDEVVVTVVVTDPGVRRDVDVPHGGPGL
jgi:molybdenum cofactor cytidylyltransferase